MDSAFYKYKLNVKLLYNIIHLVFLIKQLQEYEKAVNQRDNLIENLTSALEQALSDRDAVTTQLNTFNMQLTNPAVNNVNLQQKVSSTFHTSIIYLIVKIIMLD